MKQKGLSSIESPFCMAETETALIFSAHRNDWKQRMNRTIIYHVHNASNEKCDQ
ncbi:hypothetical protein [Bacillus pumilus]|uniref:hypothetical protein n=1 Tax=Bacillus pumilus TaxID=1408 RepID=UPI003B66CD69